MNTWEKDKSIQETVLNKTCGEFVWLMYPLEVHRFLSNNKPMIINKVLCDVNSNSDLPNFKKIVILKEISFEFLNRNCRSVIVDRDNIILWKRQYLCCMKKYTQTRTTNLLVR